jgi:hypothetical protein
MTDTGRGDEEADVAEVADEQSVTDGPAGFGPPTTNPWGGFRGVLAGTLILEVIVVLLAFPVIATVGGGVTWFSGAYVGVLALLMVLGVGLQRRSWAIPYNLALQVALIVGWVIHPVIGVLGILFGLVWLYFLYIRKDIAYREAHGLLPGQGR